MADLVTSEQARQHLRIDSADDDPWLDVMIPAVSDAITSWLKDEWRAYVVERGLDGSVTLGPDGRPVLVLKDGEAVVQPKVMAAALVELAQQYRFRDGSGAAEVPSHWGHGFVLGVGATSLLASIRKSTVA